MALVPRIRSAAQPAFLHLLLSLLVASVVAWVVFRVWYPSPFHNITGGGALFIILMAVDVVCGPLLTLVLYDSAKARWKWRVDIALIAITQLSALIYGLVQVAAARPVFVAFEGDRFRVVQAQNVDRKALQDAAESLRSLGYGGPRWLGVRLARMGDADHLNSLQLAIHGLHPAFRPSRWRPFEEQKPELQQALKPIGALRQKNPQGGAALDARLAKLQLTDDQVGFLPLVHEQITDWVVLVRRDDGQPCGYLHLDGW